MWMVGEYSRSRCRWAYPPTRVGRGDGVFSPQGSQGVVTRVPKPFPRVRLNARFQVNVDPTVRDMDSPEVLCTCV